ncbi:hypothetical protein [uncultured Bacteroides sp.]|uniref:hypothetical protein n=1 Tax=uncultured Bacteroides sp. TaxID=162156 RepID=UPI0026338953|nr:hypothetical protein [uncultured Bacteroides sp.]
MKWIDRMVEKVTRCSTPLNTSFKMGVHAVVCRSGLPDYVCVNVDGIDLFSFDFWLKELVIESSCQCPYNIVDAFDMLYDDVHVTVKNE